MYIILFLYFARLVLCPTGWTSNPANSACYLHIEDQVNPVEARQRCKARNGYLASIYTPEERDFTKSKMSICSSITVYCTQSYP